MDETPGVFLKAVQAFARSREVSGSLVRKVKPWRHRRAVQRQDQPATAAPTAATVATSTASSSSSPSSSSSSSSSNPDTKMQQQQQQQQQTVPR
jgi:hypothetical protein